MADFFPPQPNLYTVEVYGRPVVVLSASPVLSPPPDNMLANPEVIEALRLARQAMSQLDEAAQGKGIDLDLGEIYEALETYLGDDLLTLEDAASGRPLWGWQFEEPPGASSNRRGG